jgi:hypothetical protein
MCGRGIDEHYLARLMAILTISATWEAETEVLWSESIWAKLVKACLTNNLDIVVHKCNPNYLRGRHRIGV